MICTGITYDSDYNRIKVQYNGTDGTKGASFSNPYTFEDIYDTDVANSWGRVIKSENQYVFSASLYIYDYGGYFQDTNIYFLWKGNDLDDYGIFIINNNVRFYSCVFDKDNIGVSRFRSNYGGTEFHNCVFKNWRYLMVHSYFNKCLCENVEFPYVRNGASWNNSVISNGYYLQAYGQGEVNNVTLIDFSNAGIILDGIYVVTGIYEYNYLKVINTPVDLYVRCRRYSPTYIFNNCELSFDSIRTDVFGLDYGVQRVTGILRTTFNVNITQNDYDLLIYDKDDNVIVDEKGINSYSDNIDYDMFYKETQDGVMLNDVREIYQPFKLVATKTGYDDLVIVDIFVTPGQPTIIRSSMTEIPPGTRIYNSTLYNTNIN